MQKMPREADPAGAVQTLTPGDQHASTTKNCDRPRDKSSDNDVYISSLGLVPFRWGCGRARKAALTNLESAMDTAHLKSQHVAEDKSLNTARSASLLYQVAIVAAAALLIFSAALL